MKKWKKGLSLTMSMALAGMLLTGCGLEEKLDSYLDEKQDVTQTISADSKWINSDVVGAVNENTNVSEKDDFSTAINKEWLIAAAEEVKG